MASKKPAAPTKPTRSPLQEVFYHLDHYALGNTYIAWYGQLRAEGQTHAEALENTIFKWRLREKDWYIYRMERNA